MNTLLLLFFELVNFIVISLMLAIIHLFYIAYTEESVTADQNAKVLSLFTTVFLYFLHAGYRYVLTASILSQEEVIKLWICDAIFVILFKVIRHIFHTFVTIK